MAGQVASRPSGHRQPRDHRGAVGREPEHPDGERVFGTPAFEMSKAVEAAAIYKRLPELRQTIRELERRVAGLEQLLTAKPPE